jgi:dCTP deaminase
MILSGKEIQKRLGTDIIIEPFNEKQLNPNSYNLKLHNELLVYDVNTLDMRTENKTKKIIIPDEGLIIEPGELYLGRCVEKIGLSNLCGKVEGRSSVGRLGIAVHVTATFVDSFWGFTPHTPSPITLEIFCIRPVRIYPLVEICQIIYDEVRGECVPYNGKYQSNNGTQASMIYKDFQK